MTTTWDAPSVILVITAFGTMCGTLIAAVFAGLASVRAGRASQKVDQVGTTVAGIEVKTDGTMTRLSEQNKMLSDKLEALTLSQLSAVSAAHQVALARVQALEAEIVKRADAAPPVTPAGGWTDPQAATFVESLEHDRKNRKAAAAAQQSVLEDLHKRVLQLTPLVDPDGVPPVKVEVVNVPLVVAEREQA